MIDYREQFAALRWPAVAAIGAVVGLAFIGFVTLVLLVVGFFSSLKTADYEPGISVTVACHEGEFMAAENSSLMHEAVRYIGTRGGTIYFAPGVCNIATPLELRDYGEPITISGAHLQATEDLTYLIVIHDAGRT